jgi:hypothetical protein
MNAYAGCTTVVSSSLCNFKPVDGSAGNSCEREADICPDMNIKTRVQNGHQLLYHVDVRKVVPSCGNAVDNSCCGTENSQIAPMKVENNAAGDADEQCYTNGLSESECDELLKIFSAELIRVETENSNVNCVSDTAAKEYIDKSGECSTPSQMNVQTVESLLSQIGPMPYADVSDLPVQAQACGTRAAGAQLYPIGTNRFQPPSVQSPPQLLPQVQSTIAILEKQSMPPVTLDSQVPSHSSQQWQQRVHRQQTAASGITHSSAASPTNQASFTGSCQQSILPNSCQSYGRASPLSSVLHSDTLPGCSTRGQVAASQPGANRSSTADTNWVRCSVCCFIMV